MIHAPIPESMLTAANLYSKKWFFLNFMLYYKLMLGNKDRGEYYSSEPGFYIDLGISML